jgi:hypothetical protein
MNIKETVFNILVDILIEARGDATQKFGVPFPAERGTGERVVPDRGSDKAKRLAARIKKSKAERKRLAGKPVPTKTYSPTKRDYGDNTYRGDSD